MRREVSPRTIVLSILLVLGLIQFFYWRGLLGPQAAAPPGSMGGGPSPSLLPPPMGNRDLVVRELAGGIGPGLRDGWLWEAAFLQPTGLALSPGGVLFVADTGNHCLRRVGPEGRVETVAGNPVTPTPGWQDGAALKARFRHPMGLALDEEGDLWVADTGNHVLRRLSPSGEVLTVAGRPQERGFADGPAKATLWNRPTGLAWDDAGGLYVADTGNRAIRRLLPNGQVETVLRGSPLVAPMGLLWSRDDGLLVADPGAHRIFQVSPSGQVRALPLPCAEEATAAAFFPDLAEPWLQGLPGLRARWVEPQPPPPPQAGDERLVAPVALAPSESPHWFWVADAGAHALFLIQPSTATLALEVGVFDHPSLPGVAQEGRGDQRIFNRPLGLARREDGGLYVADTGNHRLCIVSLQEVFHGDSD